MQILVFVMFLNYTYKCYYYIKKKNAILNTFIALKNWLSLFTWQNTIISESRL